MARRQRAGGRSVIGWVVLLGLGLGGGGGSVPAAERLIDGIAAQVGSDVVLLSEVEQTAAPVERRMREQGAPEEAIAEMRAEVLDRLIEQKLIAQFARRAEIEATDAEVDDAIAAIARENHLAPDQLRHEVEARGLPYPAYREQIREQIVHEKVIAGMVRPRVHVEEDEIRALYRKRYADQPEGGTALHLRHLVVTPRGRGPAAMDRACERAERALTRIRSGEPFEAVARELSDANREKGGDLGWLHDADLAEWMRPVVASLRPGQTSDVIRTGFGCNLLQLVERREFHPVSYEEARPALREELVASRLEEEYRRFLDRLREQTYIERKGIFREAERLRGPASASEPSGPPGP